MLRDIDDSATLAVAAETWLKAKRADWASKNHVIESTNIAHLDPAFGKRLLSDIGASDGHCLPYRNPRKQAHPAE